MNLTPAVKNHAAGSKPAEYPDDLKKKIFFNVLGYCLIIGIGIFDFATGNKLGFSIFYLLPIMIITYNSRMKYTIFVALFSAVVWVYVDFRSNKSYDYSFIPYWNALIRLSYFVIIAYLLSRLRGALKAEKRLSRTDSSVDIFNMRYFYEVANDELERQYRHKHVFSVAYMDLDNFKNVNDVYGHVVGNRALNVIAHLIRDTLRKIDKPARFGGDEFVILFPETNQNAARAIVNRLRNNLMVSMRENNWPVTFSIGVVTFVNLPGTVEDVVKIADTCMYKVKNSGKNNIACELY
jgi:diguanylate cyclase (GGDEF)-like protein